MRGRRSDSKWFNTTGKKQNATSLPNMRLPLGTGLHGNNAVSPRSLRRTHGLCENVTALRCMLRYCFAASWTAFSSCPPRSQHRGDVASPTLRGLEDRNRKAGHQNTPVVRAEERCRKKKPETSVYNRLSEDTVGCNARKRGRSAWVRYM